MLATTALNEDADFVGYMENLEQMERERERINKMLEEHEVCSKFSKNATLSSYVYLFGIALTL